jgi:hypothetical protein
VGGAEVATFLELGMEVLEDQDVVRVSEGCDGRRLRNSVSGVDADVDGNAILLAAVGEGGAEEEVGG